MPSNLKPKADEGSGKEGNDLEASGGKAEAQEAEETKRRAWKKEAKGKA